MQKEELQNYIKESIQSLYLRDIHLFDHNVNERTITGQLASYLKSYISDYNIDCEYNRNMSDPKRVNGSIHNPDIIIHRRGSNDHNVLWCEAKTYWYSDNKDADIETIKGAIIGALNYKFGLYIKFGQTSEDCECLFFYKNDIGEIEVDTLF